MARLLVSVRGPREAIEAAKGGAEIADVEFPSSALGTPYPLNVLAVRRALIRRGFRTVALSTNIGEKQQNRSSACQAALGIATAGADIIKCGVAELSLEAAVYQSKILVRTVKHFYRNAKVIPAVFVDEDLMRFLDPFGDGPTLLSESRADGLLVDTFDKSRGKGLLDYCDLLGIRRLASRCHQQKRELWVAGSLIEEEMPGLWRAGVDVICVRGAACEPGRSGRFGEVKAGIVAKLIGRKP
jgi:uncharacterized protein (UPF0264 family)